MQFNYSRLGFVIMVAGLIALILSHSLFSGNFWVILVQSAAVLLMLWARWTFGRRSFHFEATPTEGNLVTWGAYRWIRHPIYTAACLFSIAGVCAHLSVYSLAMLAIIIAGALLRVWCEENLLVAKYPEYQVYQSRTRRMVPYVF